MGNKLFSMLFLTILLSSCRTLQSSTWIDAGKSFVLGEGKHGAFSATVRNNGTPEVEIISMTGNGVQSALGTLKRGEKSSYNVPADTQVIFKNKGNQQGVLDLQVKGDISLSMKYQTNKNADDVK